MLVGIGGKLLAEAPAIEGFVLLNQPFESLQADLGVGLDALFLLQLGQQFLEMFPAQAHHDVGEHGHEAAVGIVGKPLVVRQFRQADPRLLVEAQVEDGIHHPRHGDPRARADGDEERILRVAEVPASPSLDLLECLQRLLPHIRWEVAGLHILNTCLGSDGETGGHGEPRAGHVGQTSPFAAEYDLHLAQFGLVAQRLGQFLAGRTSKVHPFLLTHNIFTSSKV